MYVCMYVHAKFDDVSVVLVIRIYTHTYRAVVAWCSGNALVVINEVTLRRARLVLGWVNASADG